MNDRHIPDLPAVDNRERFDITDQCAICLDNFSHGVQCARCKKHIHTWCILKLTSKSCPMCRYDKFTDTLPAKLQVRLNERLFRLKEREEARELILMHKKYSPP